MDTEKNWAKKALAYAKGHKVYTALALILCVIGAVCLVSRVRMMFLSPVERLARSTARYYNKNSDDIQLLRKVKTSNGTQVLFCQNNWYFCHYAFVAYVDEQGILRNDHIGIPYAEILDHRYDSRIFYDEEYLSTGSYLSSMTKVTTNKGTDVVILIVPSLPEEGQKSKRPYEDYPEYGVPLYDTLNNSFDPIYSKSGHPSHLEADDVPMWMLVLDYDTLPTDYELHYGEYVLTYEDIENGHWEPQ